MAQQQEVIIADRKNIMSSKVKVLDENYRYYWTFKNYNKFLTGYEADMKFNYSKYGPVWSNAMEILDEKLEGNDQIIMVLLGYLTYGFQKSPQGYTYVDCNDWLYHQSRNLMRAYFVRPFNMEVVVYRQKVVGEDGYDEDEIHYTVQVQERKQFVANCDTAIDNLRIEAYNNPHLEEDSEIWINMIDHMQTIVSLPIIHENYRYNLSMIVLEEFEVRIDTTKIIINAQDDDELRTYNWANSAIWSKVNQ